MKQEILFNLIKELGYIKVTDTSTYRFKNIVNSLLKIGLLNEIAVKTYIIYPQFRDFSFIEVKKIITKRNKQLFKRLKLEKL